MSQISSLRRRLLCQALALSMVVFGLTVLATPQAHAAADAVISGTVVDSATSQPLARVTITDSSSGRSVTTAVAGTYSLALPAGDHVLTATFAGYVPAATPTLTLTAGQVLNPQAFTLEQYASASGRVTETGKGTGIATVVVKLFDSGSRSPNPVVAATTGPDGSWSTADVAPGSYRVQFDASQVGFQNGWYGGATRETATVVTLSAGQTRTMDGVLARGKVTASATTISAQGVGSLSGRVTIEPGGIPGTGMYVTAYEDGSAAHSSSMWTDADGNYSFTQLQSGYYTVDAGDTINGAYEGYLGGAVSSALATYVWIGSGAALTGQDIHLQQTATLSGTVTDRGRPVAGASVGVTGMGAFVRTVTSAADGSYQLTGIPPGTYRLSATTDHVGWWNGATDIGSATPITVTAAGHLTGYAIAMPPTYTLSGTVRNAAGTVVPGEAVFLETGTDQRVAMTDASGAYSLPLVAGTYELGVRDSGMATVLWSPGSTTPVLFALSADTVRNVTIPDKRTVTVPVVGADGSVPPMVTIWVYNSHNEYALGLSSPTGTVTLPLPPGTYRFESSVAGYLPWSSQVTVTTAMTVPVTLQVAGHLTGTLSGAPATVTAINTTTGAMFTTLNTPIGQYSMAELPFGDYVVTAAPSTQYYVVCGPASWFGGTSYATARRLHVGGGTSLTGVDFTLSCPASWTVTGKVIGDTALPPSAPAGAAAGVIVQVTNTVTSVTSTTDSNGSFQFSDLLPGTYDVSAYQSALGLEGHASVTVTVGSSMFLAINLTKRGLVSGQVVGPHGEPVVAKVSDGATSVYTDAQGNFSLGGIPYGTHTITAVPQSPYATAFLDTTVSAGSDVVGVVIHAPLASRMQGLFTGGDPVKVTVFDAAGRIVASDTFGSSFVYYALPPGMLKVRFSGPGIVTEWWKDAATAAAATAVAVPEGGGVTDISPVLSPSSAASSTTISGTVTYAGSPLAGVTISTKVGWPTVTATSGGDGTYSLSVPRGDTYPLTAAICLGPQEPTCTGQNFSDVRTVVADSATKTGVDFVVPLLPNSFTTAVQPVVTGRAVSGQVLTATVGAWTPAPDSMTWQWYADGLPIYQATGTTFTLTDAQVGTVIQVVATGEKAGYATTTMPSAGTGPVEVPGGIHSLSPSRLLDSRIGQGFSGPAGNGTVITLPVWGNGGVPVGASAVLMNLTVTQPTAGGFLTAYASGGAVPGVSNANFTAGTTLANLSLVPVGADGAIALRTSVAGSVHVIADVQGYVVGGAVTAAGALKPVTPTRVFDSRTTQRVAASSSIDVVVAGGVVPVGATAVVANLTVTGPGRSGYLTAWPTGVARPTASNVNFVAGQTVPNMAIVKVGATNSISIFNSAASPIDVIVDLQGYVTAGTPTLPGTVQPITPTRVLDTRDGYYPLPGNTGGWVDFSSPDLAKVPQGVLINLTVAEPQAAGWLSAFPYGVERPVVSNLNYTAGAVVPNLALVALTDGYGVVYNGSIGSAHVIIDVLAYVLS